jgi:cytidylate kinase
VAIGQALGKLHPATIFQGNCAHLTLDGSVPTDECLRQPTITQAVASYARIPAIRSFLQNYQRTLPAVVQSANFPGLIVEGRDMTTVVFPNATLRYFLHVEATERIRRRMEEGVYDNIPARDGMDMEHLSPASGVRTINGTGRTLDEVVAIIGQDLEALFNASPR